MCGTRSRVDDPRMDEARILLTLAALADGTLLYALMVGRRAHERRLQERLQASAHLYGLVRITLADRRMA
jgi:hypothetical protein